MDIFYDWAISKLKSLFFIFHYKIFILRLSYVNRETRIL